MIWQDEELHNPVSGKPLRRDSQHSFSDGTERFPIIDEIPFLRPGREKLKAEVLRALDLDDNFAALVLLLQDKDDWARNAVPDEKDLQSLLGNDNATLREAMERLNYGAVADYFAYRWSDPTFLSGLALLEWHVPHARSQTIFELCCGIGHYLREMDLRGVKTVGADVVFSKLWLARHFVAPASCLICLDANFPLPFADKVFDHAFCHDAFYFLPEKRIAAAELKRTTAGSVLIGHAHNAAADNFSSGAAITVNQYAEIFESDEADSIFYDDAELTFSTIENRKPQAETITALKSVAAVSVAVENEKSKVVGRGYVLPPENRSLRPNPLLFDVREKQFRRTPLFPSARYESEYAELSGYLNLNGETVDENDLKRAVAGDWYSNERLRNFARRRILLDLPEKW